VNKDSGVMFLLDEKKKAITFVYRPTNVLNSNNSQVQNATLGVKFAQCVCILDPWEFALKFLTRKQRILFRLKHPIVYSKRGFRNLYHRVKHFFFGDPPRNECYKEKK
jgi:hypothetical protein